MYKLRAELQTVRNKKEFAEFENEKLREEVEDVKRYGKRGGRKEEGSSNKEQEMLTPKHVLEEQHESEDYQSLTFSPHPHE